MEALQAIDQGLLYRFETLHRPWLDKMFKFLSDLDRFQPLVVIAVVACLAFLKLRQYRTAGILALAAVAGYCLGEAARQSVQRPRPDVTWRLIERPSNYSFPSGHALNSMLILTGVALLVARRLPRRRARYILVGLAATLAVLIGISRIYLGVHYPLDVFGGWCAGLALALLAYWADERWVPLREPNEIAEKHKPGTSAPGPTRQRGLPSVSPEIRA
jgi:undecaprenyl-diphosphatase